MNTGILPEQKTRKKKKETRNPSLNNMPYSQSMLPIDNMTPIRQSLVGFKTLPMEIEAEDYDFYSEIEEEPPRDPTPPTPPVLP